MIVTSPTGNCQVAFISDIPENLRTKWPSTGVITGIRSLTGKKMFYFICKRTEFQKYKSIFGKRLVITTPFSHSGRIHYLLLVNNSDVVL